jgi:hypothetical protein
MHGRHAQQVSRAGSAQLLPPPPQSSLLLSSLLTFGCTLSLALLPCRVAAIVQRLVYDLKGTKIALLGLLPRGSRGAPDPYAQPNIFSAAIDRVNEGFRCAGIPPTPLPLPPLLLPPLLLPLVPGSWVTNLPCSFCVFKSPSAQQALSTVCHQPQLPAACWAQGSGTWQQARALRGLRRATAADAGRRQAR